MVKLVYTGNEKRRFSTSGFTCVLIPQQEIEIPDDKVAIIKKVLPNLLKSVQKKKDDDSGSV